MASEDEIDQYEYFKNIAEDLGFSIWRNSGRFVLLDKGGGVASLIVRSYVNLSMEYVMVSHYMESSPH